MELSEIEERNRVAKIQLDEEKKKTQKQIEEEEIRAKVRRE